MTLQPPLIKSDRRRCVLATVEDARRCLRDWEATEDSVLDLIDQRYLLAWNIALSPDKLRKDKSPRAREIRIFPESLTHFEMFAGRRKFGGPSGTEWSEDKVFKRLLEGFAGRVLTSADLRLLLNCGPTHITNLIDAKVLVQAAGTDYRRGPGGAAIITLDTFRRFLKSRLEGSL